MDETSETSFEDDMVVVDQDEATSKANCRFQSPQTRKESSFEYDMVIVTPEAITQATKMDVYKEAHSEKSEGSSSRVSFVYNLKGSFDPLTYIYVRGRTGVGCTRFAVDFICGMHSKLSANIAFHFNPRLQEGYVMRCSLLHGCWGLEEDTSGAPFTLRPDADFELVFYMTPDEFLVSIDGLPFCAFRHRFQAERITCVEFVGDIVISECAHYRCDHYPFIGHHRIEEYDIPYDAPFTSAEDMQLTVPFYGRIAEPLKTGNQIEICGRVKLLPHSFFVNLQHGHNTFPHPIIPLHLNPRFGSSCGSNAFVRNTWKGDWLQEERSPAFPFTPGYSFSLIIHINTFCYSIWVDGKLIAEYTYQVENKFPVNAIYIQGDIYLRHISIHRKSGHTTSRFNEEKPSPIL